MVERSIAYKLVTRENPRVIDMHTSLNLNARLNKRVARDLGTQDQYQLGKHALYA